MIEVIYKEEKQEAQGDDAMFYIPRNIRQIGLIRENYKIYIEDYVYTFLVRLSRAEDEKEGQKARVAVLTGETKWWSGTTYLFVKGALMVNDMEAAADHIDFTEEVWIKIHEEQEKYFEEQEIVGWFFSQPQLPMEMTELLTRVHLKNFGGEKILMLMEPQEREDAFFRYENNFMARQSGYYIYYEKNPLMQAYMIEKNKELQPELTEKFEDDAVKSFRKIIKGKDKDETEEEQPSVFSYAATACLAIAVLVVGVNFYRNYQNMNRVSNDTQTVSSVIVEEVTPTPTGILMEDEEEKQDTALKETEENTDLGQTDERQETKETEQENQTEEIKEQDSEQNVEEPEEDNTDTAEADETATSSIYQEESDIRKAKRREALEAAAQENQEVSSENVHETYVIKPGDTLFQISMARYGNMAAIQEICDLNNMTAEEIIYPGQVIVLP